MPRFAVQYGQGARRAFVAGVGVEPTLSRIMSPFSTTGAVTRCSPTENRTPFLRVKTSDPNQWTMGP